MHFTFRATTLLLAASVAILPGCKTRPITAVAGQVMNNGVPYSFSVQGKTKVRIRFVSLSTEDRCEDDVKPDDGAFRITGIPPGKYRILLSKDVDGGPDEFKDEFGEERSPLEVVIPQRRSVRLEVDIGTRNVSVK